MKKLHVIPRLANEKNQDYSMLVAFACHLPRWKGSGQNSATILRMVATSPEKGFARRIERVRTLGSGTYGSVYLASDADGNKIVTKIATPGCSLSQQYLAVEGEINAILLKEDPSGAAGMAAPYLGEQLCETEKCLVWNYLATSKPLDDYAGDLPGLASALACDSSTVMVKLTQLLLQALRTLHRIGVCHRDIKPANILVDESSHSIRIIDFGSAARWKRVKIGPFISLAVEKVGYDRNKSPCDPLYAAPEKWVDEEFPDRFDVYSAALTLLRIGFPALQDSKGLTQFNTDFAAAQFNLDSWLQHQLTLAAALPSDSPQAMDLRNGLTLFNDDNGTLWKLLRRMLEQDPRRRISAEAALAENPVLNRI